MKIRTDYVTNSSSSSFVLAHAGEFTDEQKKAIGEEVIKMVMGKKVLGPESTEEEITQKIDVYRLDYDLEDAQTKIREVLKEGKSLYWGHVSFEDDSPIYEISRGLQSIWEAMEEACEGNFEGIYTDLRY